MLIIPPDAPNRAVGFLKGYYPGMVGHDLPESFAYDRTFVRVVDTGGSGAYDHALHEKRLTIEVWAASWKTASEVASRVYALLRNWPYIEPGVYWRRSVSAPQRFPDETRRPRYVLTVELAFRATEEALNG